MRVRVENDGEEGGGSAGVCLDGAAGCVDGVHGEEVVCILWVYCEKRGRDVSSAHVVLVLLLPKHSVNWTAQKRLSGQSFDM